MTKSNLMGRHYRISSSVVLSSNKTIGLPSHTKDINGVTIYTGDEVTYDFEDNTATFTVVFEHNAFRKKYYRDIDDGNIKPMLEYGIDALKMRLKVIQKP